MTGTSIASPVIRFMHKMCQIDNILIEIWLYRHRRRYRIPRVRFRTQTSLRQRISTRSAVLIKNTDDIDDVTDMW